MKLEVPHLRIMRGEAKNLSPAAKGLLLSLIACQDQYTMTISWSKAHLADISSLNLRTAYRALSELDKGNWITRNHQLIQLVITTQTISDAHATKQVFSDAHATDTAIGTGLHATIDDTHATNSDTAKPPNHDQRDLKDHDIQRLSSLVLSIGERYQLTTSNYKRLWDVCQNAEYKKLSNIFESMMKSTQVFKDPVAYITASLGNDGSGQQNFKNYVDSLPKN